MATIRDVAKAAGVSIASASRALNGHGNVTEETRNRVEAAARQLRYIPHSGARSLSSQRSNAIGVVLPDVYGEFFSELVHGIDRVASQAGMQLLLSSMHGSAQGMASAIRAMHGRIDGLLVMPPDMDAEHLSACLPAGIPTIVMNYPTEKLDVSGVSIDNYAGAYAMVEFMVAQGYRRIAHIAGPRENRDARQRLLGFSDAMAKLTGERSPIVLPGDFSEEAGAEAARVLIAGRLPVDAVFAANDMMAVGCLSVLREAGVSVPTDMAVTGFDDIPLARHVGPPLTTMQVHIADMGATAMAMVLQHLRQDNPIELSKVVLQPSLIQRQSTATAGPNAVQKGRVTNQGSVV